MSVINKMLRDLDSRQAAGALPAQTQGPRTGAARGTQIVNDANSGRHRLALPRAAVLVAIAALALGGGAGWWYLSQIAAAQHALEQARLATAAQPQPVLQPAPVAIASALPASAAGAVPILPSESVPLMVALAAPVAPEPARTKSTVVATLPMPVPLPVPRVAPVSPPPPAPVPAPSVDVAARNVAPAREAAARAATLPASMPSVAPRQAPALEALAQAQNLWNEGARVMATDLLREALAATERASLANPPTGSPTALAALARELARMELAEGRASQALELLTRLEPSLSSSADVWAIRGNAAQRLGRHQESAAAYRTALKLRPDEPRWMLGAAVSLAAQGQTSAAAELAEKARMGGVLSPEVSTYLRQLGVALSER